MIGTRGGHRIEREAVDLAVEAISQYFCGVVLSLPVLQAAIIFKCGPARIIISFSGREDFYTRRRALGCSLAVML